MIFLVARLLREAGTPRVEVFDAPGTYLIGTERETFDFNNIVRRGREQGIAVTMGDAGRRPEDRQFFTAQQLSVSLDWLTAITCRAISSMVAMRIDPSR